MFWKSDAAHAEGPKYVAIAGEQSSEVSTLHLISLLLFFIVILFFCVFFHIVHTIYLQYDKLICEGWDLGSQYCRKDCTITSKVPWWILKLLYKIKRSDSDIYHCLTYDVGVFFFHIWILRCNAWGLQDIVLSWKFMIWRFLRLWRI